MVVAAAAGVGAILAPLALAAAATDKYEIEFARQHECTREVVEGDTLVHTVMTTSQNPDGSIHVRVRQHGHSLEGVISGDEYVFNEGQDTTTDYDVGSGDRVEVRTVFVHRGEDQAFAEVPGLDDLHQRFVYTFGPLGETIIEEEETECR